MSAEAKVGLTVALAAAIGVAGYVAAVGPLAPDETAGATVVTKRIVTLHRKHGPPKVVTQSTTVTGPGDTSEVTVSRDGRTVVVQTPGETKTRTVRGPVRQRVVTRRQTDTVLRTETSNRVDTVTAPAQTQTETVTREVTQPQRTVTDTVTDPLTVTDQVTTTTAVTVTETVTVTRKP